MPSAPRFWAGPPSPAAWALSPLAWAYGAIAARRMRRAPRVPTGLPVLCVGNLTVGGVGKTPVVIALAQAAKAAGLKPGVLSRGHGGSVNAARLVDPTRDLAADVGDEPLLLGCHAPVAVGTERARGARLLAEAGCNFLLMDDGFQSARIAADLALLVIDRRTGAGNGFCLPAGPLRAPVSAQLAQRPELLALGEGPAADPVIGEALELGLPIHRGRIEPSNAEAVRGRRVLAFAGIGRPEKFFESLAQAGAQVVERKAFPDHHPFRAAELQALQAQAQAEKLELATTAKDRARLRGTLAPAVLAKLLVLEVDVVFAQAGTAEALVERALRNFETRKAEGPDAVSGARRTD